MNSAQLVAYIQFCPSQTNTSQILKDGYFRIYLIQDNLCPVEIEAKGIVESGGESGERFG